MADEVVSVALIVAGSGIVTGLIAPGVLVFLNSRQRQKEKEQDYERQDTLAKLEHERQDKVAARAEKTATLLLESTNKIVKATTVTVQKLDDVASNVSVVHALVNSNLTEAITGRLTAVVAGLSGLQEIIELKRANGKEPSKKALDAVTRSEALITELEATIEERRKQQVQADAIAATTTATKE